MTVNGKADTSVIAEKPYQFQGSKEQITAAYQAGAVSGKFTKNQTVTIRLTDRAGNITEIQKEIGNIDKLEPVIGAAEILALQDGQLKAAADVWATGKKVRVQVEDQEADANGDSGKSGIQTVFLTANPKTEDGQPKLEPVAGSDYPMELEQSTGSYLTKDYITADQPELGNTFYLIAIDKAGNRTVQEITIKKIDGTGPEVQVKVSNAAVWAQAKTIQVTAKDSGCGVKTITILPPGGTSPSDDIVHTAQTVSAEEVFTTDAWTKMGTYQITASDDLGNTSQRTSIVIDQIDTTAPAVDSFTVTADSTKRSVTVQASDPQPVEIGGNGAGIIKLEYALSDGLDDKKNPIITQEWQDISTLPDYTPNEDGTWTFELPLEGNYYLRLTDNSLDNKTNLPGNVSEPVLIYDGRNAINVTTPAKMMYAVIPLKGVTEFFAPQYQIRNNNNQAKVKVVMQDFTAAKTGAGGDNEFTLIPDGMPAQTDKMTLYLAKGTEAGAFHTALDTRYSLSENTVGVKELGILEKKREGNKNNQGGFTLTGETYPYQEQSLAQSMRAGFLMQMRYEVSAE